MCDHRGTRAEQALPVAQLRAFETQTRLSSRHTSEAPQLSGPILIGSENGSSLLTPEALPTTRADTPEASSIIARSALSSEAARENDFLTLTIDQGHDRCY